MAALPDRRTVDTARVAEARGLAVDLILHDLNGRPFGITLDPAPTVRDVGKFTLKGKVPRAIHHFSGWNLPINPRQIGRYASSSGPPRPVREETATNILGRQLMTEIPIIIVDDDDEDDVPEDHWTPEQLEEDLLRTFGRERLNRINAQVIAMQRAARRSKPN